MLHITGDSTMRFRTGTPINISVSQLFSFADNVEYELGTGTFGKVFQCHDRKHDQKVAVKVVRSIKVQKLHSN